MAGLGSTRIIFGSDTRVSADLNVLAVGRAEIDFELQSLYFNGEKVWERGSEKTPQDALRPFFEEQEPA